MSASSRRSSARCLGKMIAGVIPFLDREKFEVVMIFTRRPGSPPHNLKDKITKRMHDRADVYIDAVAGSLEQLREVAPHPVTPIPSHLLPCARSGSTGRTARAPLEALHVVQEVLEELHLGLREGLGGA